MYQTLDTRLTGRCKDSRKVANHTYLVRRGESIALKLHQTDVVTFHQDGTIQLNSGGWQTYTTKERISAYHRVSSRKGIWYLEDGSLFYDGVTIGADGKAVNPVDGASHEKKVADLKKAIKKYAQGFAQNSKDIALPSSGDCWGCAFQVDGNDPRNRTEPMGTDHYWEHFEEGYYVPSLLGNAILAKGYSNPGFVYSLCQTGPWQTQKLVYNFLLKQLLPGLS